jgi:hypothetical protein
MALRERSASLIWEKRKKMRHKVPHFFSFFPFSERAPFPERNEALAECSRRVVPFRGASLFFVRSEHRSLSAVLSLSKEVVQSRGATSSRISNLEFRISNFESRISNLESRISNFDARIIAAYYRIIAALISICLALSSLSRITIHLMI